MSDPRGRFAAAALGAACLVVGVAACGEPAVTVPQVAVAPASPAAPAPAPTTADATPTPSLPSTTAPAAAPTAPTPAPTSVPPPPRTAPTRTSTPRATASPKPAPSSSSSPAPTPAPVPPPPPPQSGTDAYEGQILALVNAQRSAVGLRPLAAQSCADGFAEPWSPHMAAEGRLSHQSLNPVLSRCGGRAAAENVGMNSSAAPGDMVAGFMGSPPHRANILNGSYTGIGIGAYRDARGVWWVTQDFVG